MNKLKNKEINTQTYQIGELVACKLYKTTITSNDYIYGIGTLRSIEPGLNGYVTCFKIDILYDYNSETGNLLKMRKPYTWKAVYENLCKVDSVLTEKVNELENILCDYKNIIRQYKESVKDI